MSSLVMNLLQVSTSDQDLIRDLQILSSSEPLAVPYYEARIGRCQPPRSRQDSTSDQMNLKQGFNTSLTPAPINGAELVLY